MRFSITVLFAASLASAYTILKRQDPPAVPACAQTCFDQSPMAPCDPTDTACLCVNPTFLNALGTCTQSACSADEVTDATAAGKALCKNAGVDLDNPVPACAVACDQTATSSSTCAKDDVACFCKDTTYIQNLVQCATGSCTPEEVQTATNVGQAVCRANGVDISSAVGA